MLEKLEFRELVGTSVGTSVNLERNRMPRAMSPSGFLLTMILAAHHNPGGVCWLLAVEPAAVSGAGADVPGVPAGGAFADAEHLLAFSVVVAFERGTAAGSMLEAAFTIAISPPGNRSRVIRPG
jgi:hypothetical protein